MTRLLVSSVNNEPDIVQRRVDAAAKKGLDFIRQSGRGVRNDGRAMRRHACFSTPSNPRL